MQRGRRNLLKACKNVKVRQTFSKPNEKAKEGLGVQLHKQSSETGLSCRRSSVKWKGRNSHNMFSNKTFARGAIYSSMGEKAFFIESSFSLTNDYTLPSTPHHRFRRSFRVLGSYSAFSLPKCRFLPSHVVFWRFKKYLTRRRPRIPTMCEGMKRRENLLSLLHAQD